MNIYDIEQLNNLLNQQKDFIRPNPLQFQYSYIPGGITNVVPKQTFQDFYSPVYEPYDLEKDDEQVSYNELTGQPYIKDRISGFAQNIIGQPGISSLIGLINPVAGLVSRGLGYLGRNLNPSFVGPKGSRPYDYNESILSTFGRSTTGTEFFQNMRDKKAREEAAERGLEKQREKARLDMTRAIRDINTGGGGGGGIGTSSGGAASPGSQGPGGSDEMGSF
jgi:hypothetical protein